MRLTDEQEIALRSGVDRLRDQILSYGRSVADGEIPKREYDFRFTAAASLEDELRGYQQTLDTDLDHDVDQLERRNDREEKGFLRHIAKLDETIRDEEREEFKRQDQQYAHLKRDPDDWNLHKEAQEYEARRREQVRGVYYMTAVQDFIHDHGNQHENRLDAIHAQNDANVEKLNEAYERHVAQLEQAAQALEQAREDIVREQPDRPQHVVPALRQASGGMGREEFHSLVLAGQEHELERE